MSARYRLRFFFDYGSGICLWSDNDAALEAFDYPVAANRLPLSPETVRRADEVLAWYDRSLNWDDPGAPLLWRQEECDRFNAAVRALLASLREELGEEFEVVDEFRGLAEEPHLDAYLADPDGFRSP